MLSYALAIFDLCQRSPGARISPKVRQIQSFVLREPPGIRLALSSWVRERRVYEKARYCHKPFDLGRSGHHIENFQADSASHDSAPANPCVQSRWPMAHPGKPFSRMGGRRRTTDTQSQLNHSALSTQQIHFLRALATSSWYDC